MRLFPLIIVLVLAQSSAAGAPYPSSDRDASSPIVAAAFAADPWADFLRTVAGSVMGAFVGAGLAFLANLKLQKRTRRLDELAAGNFAMATLTRQYNAFLNAQRAIREELDRCKTDPASRFPRWFIFKPIVHFLPGELEFDFRSLTFLFETSEVEFFYTLHQAESIQRDLIGHLARLNELAFLKQERFEKAGFVDGPVMSISLQHIHEVAGPRLVADLEAVIEQLEMHADQDAQQYIKAGDRLYDALCKHFGPGQRVLRLVGRAPIAGPSTRSG